MSEKALHTPCTSVRPYLKEGSLVHVWIGTPKQSMDAVSNYSSSVCFGGYLLVHGCKFLVLPTSNLALLEEVHGGEILCNCCATCQRYGTVTQQRTVPTAH